MPALRIKLPNADVRTHILRGERVTVGRAPDNAIQIRHPSISAHHAEFISVGDHYELRDLHSTNRSYVEGLPVSESALKEKCTILFGSVECEYQATSPAAAPNAPRMEIPFAAARPAPPPRPAALPEPRPDTSFLETENLALRTHLHALQRRFDILGSARLVTGRTDFSPLAAAGDVLKEVTAERDELRQQNTALNLQTERLRDELAVTARERDAARQAAEALQTERAELLEQLQKARNLVLQLETLANEPSPVLAPAPPPPRPPAPMPCGVPPPPPGAVRRAVSPPEAVAAEPAPAPEPAAPPPPPPEPQPERLPGEIRLLGELAAQFSAAPGDEILLGRLTEVVDAIALDATAHQAIGRVARALREAIRDFAHLPPEPGSSPLRSLKVATDLLPRLAEPGLLEEGATLERARLLVVDDDADLLATLETALAGAGFEVVAFGNGEDALVEIATTPFDTVLADLRLPEMSGADLCSRARELPASRKTPVLFLTVADTLDKRAETSLSGGNEFIPKPFNVAELVLKTECWSLRRQLHLL